MKFEKGKNYRHSQIESFASQNEYEYNEYGREIVGEFAIGITKDVGYGIAVTFIMVGLNTYECVYSDH